MKVFLFSNSYIENTVLFNLNYLLNDDIKELFLMEDNHSLDEFKELIGFESDIKLFNNYLYAIDNSDLIIIIYNKDMNRTVIDDVINVCLQKNKKVCVISQQQISDNYENTVIDDNIPYNEKPVVIIFNVGDFCQVHRSEIELNRLFNERNIKIKQDFSMWSQNIIKNLKKDNLLNPLIESNVEDNCDVIIKSINGNGILDINNDNELLHLFTLMKPDYVIINFEYQFRDFEEIRNIFHYRYLSKIDMIILSAYTSVISGDKKLPVLCNNKYLLYDSKIITLGMSNNIYKQVMDDIIKKIAIPDGIRQVN